MPATRKNISFAQQIAIDRRGDDYVYGGNWDPDNRITGTDCSGCVVDILDATLHGTAMQWRRNADGGGGSTEDWRPPSMGGSADPSNGPFGTVMVNDPSQFPRNAAVLVAFHHGPGGGENSHTWCQVDKLKVETNGDDGTVLNNGTNLNDQVLDVHTIDSPTTYGANNWWYLPGPIAEDGTPIPTQPSATGVPVTTPTEPPDTLYADVSEFQAVVTDAYTSATYEDDGTWPFQWIAIRSNDGDHVDENFAPNYQWCVAACAAGLITGFMVYYYWRPDGSGVNTHAQLVNSLGGPHPQMVSMMDVESGDGNGSSNQSSELTGEFNWLAAWLGNPLRVVGYGNVSDLNAIWPTKPAGLRLVIASYGANPGYPNQIAHQYTDGTGYGDGLPEGAPPFGNCDMNSADGLSPSQLAAALGIGAAVAPPPPPAPPAVSNAPAIPKPKTAAAQTGEVWDQVLLRWDQLNGRTLVEAVAEIGAKLGLPYTPSS